MKIFVKAALSLFFLLCVQCVWAQNTPEEFLRREVKINSNAYGYRVYVPKNRNPKKKLPVMLFFTETA
jgi:hypothetical protein